MGVIHACVVDIIKLSMPETRINELLEFVFRIYSGTGGAYPRMEWLETKPAPDDFDGFSRAYRDFLYYRLSEELDEVYVVENDDADGIIATFALLYTFEGKKVPWVHPAYRHCLFLEFFMVSPEWQGMGIGSKVLSFVRDRAMRMRKELCVVTFKELSAYAFYIRHGFVEVLDDGVFCTLRLKMPE